MTSVHDALAHLTPRQRAEVEAAGAAAMLEQLARMLNPPTEAPHPWPPCPTWCTVVHDPAVDDSLGSRSHSCDVGADGLSLPAGARDSAGDPAAHVSVYRCDLVDGPVVRHEWSVVLSETQTHGGLRCDVAVWRPTDDPEPLLDAIRVAFALMRQERAAAAS